MGEKIEDLKRKHQGYWLAIKVTKRGEYNQPVEGELVTQAKSHHELHRCLKDPNVYETYAGEVPTKAVLF